jgi:integrase
MERLTADDVYKAAVPKSGQTIKWDAQVRGFGLRVTAGGAKSFILNYRFADPTERRKSSQFRYTIGPARATPRGAGWSVDEARREASKWSKRIDRGESHPLAERKGRHEAVKAARDAETFRDALTDYIEHEQKGRKGNATADEVERAILRACADWLDSPLKGITAPEIGKLLRGIRDGKDSKEKKAEPAPYMANRLFAYLRTFFAWCVKPDVAKLAASPMANMSRPWDGEEPRTRWFTDKELKALWRAFDKIAESTDKFDKAKAASLKVAMLTGKRVGQIYRMRWSELADDGRWTPAPPKAKSKKRRHPIQLPKLARRVIGPKPKDADKNAYVFSGRHGGHLRSDTKYDDVKEISKVADFFPHAFKHTIETRLAQPPFKVPPHVRDVVCDHASKRGAGAGYDHYDYFSEAGEALEQWAQHIEQLVSPEGARMLR